MDENNEYLYRALREKEIEEGNILIPKSQDTFSKPPRFNVDTKFPIELDSVTNAVRQHQWKQRGYPTSGVSTTPHLERAKNYNECGAIVIINRNLLSEFGIEEFNVNKYLKSEDIACLEDDEIILVREANGPFPKEIIVRVIKK